MLRAITGLLPLFFVHTLYAQSKSTVVRQAGDSLFISTNKAITKGQLLVAGKGSAEHDWYNYIGFKNATALPLLINREADLKYNYNGRNNPEQERENDLVKASLTPGDSLILKKIRRIMDKHNGPWYKVTLVSKSHLRIRFTCNLEKAIDHNEIFVP